MPHTLSGTLAKVNRLARRLQFSSQADPSTMTDDDLCAELVGLSIKAGSLSATAFSSYEEFAEAFFAVDSRAKGKNSTFASMATPP